MFYILAPNAHMHIYLYYQMVLDVANSRVNANASVNKYEGHLLANRGYKSLPNNNYIMPFAINTHASHLIFIVFSLLGRVKKTRNLLISLRFRTFFSIVNTHINACEMIKCSSVNLQHFISLPCLVTSLSYAL